ncbi:MAG: fimbrillin family protein [Bacteroidaceae bacterium]|nr:fimbrillin family protein [Bacteroidaceae bacterium]MBO4560830.1 fimbrillin family protein [Bacteroidaceae bacterium]
MKKEIIQIIAVAVGLFSVMGCSKESGMGDDCFSDITIQASIGEMTKVSYRGDTTAFDKGDKILIYGWTGSKTTVPEQKVVDGVTNRFNGNVWVPAKQMRWKNATDKHYFLGIYPVPENLSSFTGADYTLSITDYKSSDLLIATNLGGIKATDGPVNLTFDHVMAKLNVNLRFRSEYGGTPAVSSVKTTVKTAAKVNYLTKKVTAQGDGQDVSIPKINKPAPGYNVSYSSIQIPQTGVRSITITVGDTLFVYESSQDIPLIPGKFTTIDLMIGKDVVDMNTISVSEWEAAADLTGGVAVVQDPYNGHEYVDLGLPSDLKWATCNVGASKPEEYGDYFAWGDTETKDNYNWSNYKWCNGSEETLTKYCSKGDYGKDGFTDSKTTLEAEDDAASYNWGGSWRMPTETDWRELLDNNNCKWDWFDAGNTDFGGIAGYKVTSQKDGYKDRFIFLPAAGCIIVNDLENVGYGGVYWSSSLRVTKPKYATLLDIQHNYNNVVGGGRSAGRSVRPVTE